MASVEEVKEKVISIVSEQLNIPKDDIKLESAFIADLKADSLDLVELVMEFEDEFGADEARSESWNPYLTGYQKR